MTTTEQLPQLPFAHGDTVLQVPPGYLELLRSAQPITQVRTIVGDPAWSVTKYHEVRTLLADARLGRSHPEPDKASRFSESAILGGPHGDHATEKQEHVRLRRVLTPSFSARRMTALSPRVRELVADLLNRIADQGPPADLHDQLAFTLPVLVICELLGVPAKDREQFRIWSTRMSNMLQGELAMAALGEFSGYMKELIERKRVEPGEDVISDVIAADEEWNFGIDEMTFLAVALLFAGHETTMTRIDMGTVLLLSNPEQADAMRQDPSLVPTAVEEILRMTIGGHVGVTRYAHADIEISGVTIKAGDGVLLNTDISGRDEGVFPDPDTFDITRRSDTAQLTFGYGPHFCIGASLARIELQEVFSALFERFPTLRLAVPLEELRIRTETITTGLRELPVTW